MNKIYFLIKILVLCLFFTGNVFAVKINYHDEGKKLFDRKEFEKSKIYFEKDIVFNPKSEKSYLYLAKIFNEKDDDQQQEVNLTNVLLLNPKNDEAIYLLALLKIKQSDYEGVKELIEKFELVCISFCSKKNEILEKLNKLTPKDEKNNN